MLLHAPESMHSRSPALKFPVFAPLPLPLIALATYSRVRSSILWGLRWNSWQSDVSMPSITQYACALAANTGATQGHPHPLALPKSALCVRK